MGIFCVIFFLKTRFSVVQTVPACQNLFKNSFTYHCLQYDDQKLPFEDAIQFLGKCTNFTIDILNL